MADETIRLGADFGPVSQAAKDSTARLDELGDEATKAKGKIEELESATGKAAVGNSNLGRTALESGRILQDFVQGGFGGIINNLEGFARAIGGGAGLAGGLTLVGTVALLALPKIKEFFGGVSEAAKEAADKAIEELKRVQAEMEKTHKAFVALTQKPTDYEAEEAKDTELILADRPNAEQAKRAVLAAMGRKSTEKALTEAGTRDEWGRLGPQAELTDEDIEKRAKAAEAAVMANSPGVPSAGAGVADRTRARLLREREAAQQKRFELERKAKAAYAEAVVTGATVGGPAGEAARRELRGATQGTELGAQLEDSRAENLRAYDDQVRRQAEEAAAAHERRVEREKKASHDATIESQRQQAEQRGADIAADERTRQIQADVQFGRQLGRAAQQPPRREDVGGHVPLMPMDQSVMTQAQHINVTQQLLMMEQQNQLAIQDLRIRTARLISDNRSYRQQMPANASNGLGG